MRTLILLILTALLISCSSGGGDVAGGTGVGNPVGIANTSITVAAENKGTTRAAEAIPTMTDDKGREYRISSLIVQIDRISWQTNLDEENVELDPQLKVEGDQLVLDGPFEFDALTGNVVGEKELQVNLPESGYKRVRFYLEQHNNDPIVVITGDAVSNNETIPFNFELAFDKKEVKLEDGNNSFVFLADASNQIEARFNLDEWLQYEVDPFEIGEVKNGTLTITVEDNVHTIGNNIKTSGEIIIHE